MTMTVTDAEAAEVVRLPSRDVETTLGPGHEAAIRYYATSKREVADDPVRYREMVVEEVQQEFHDGSRAPHSS